MVGILEANANIRSDTARQQKKGNQDQPQQAEFGQGMRMMPSRSDRLDRKCHRAVLLIVSLSAATVPSVYLEVYLEVELERSLNEQNRSPDGGTP